MKIFHRQWPLFLTLTLCLGAGGGCTKASRIKSLLASADRDFQAQHYDAALVEYDAVRHLSPLNTNAIRQLGLIYADEGRSALAYGFLEKAHELEPANPAVELRLAQLSLSAGKPADASDLAAKYLQTEPTNEQALLILVEASRSPSASGKVRSQLQTWIHQNPNVAAYHAALGWLDLGQQNVTNAEAELQTALRLDSHLPSAYLGMATVYAARKETNALEKALKTASDLSPIRSASRLKYAEYKAQTGASEEAKQILENITSQAPDYIPAWSDLMKIAFSEHRYDDCAAIVAKILAHDPSNFEAQLQSGNIAMATHKTDEAINQFEILEARNKKSPQVKYHLALAYLQKGETPKAAAALRGALDLDHGFVAAVLALADLDVRAGESTEAVTLLTPLIKSQPGNAQAQLLLATAYLAQRKPAGALEVYQRMAKAFPKNPSIPHLMGIIYRSEHDLPNARACFTKALELQPDYLPALDDITGLEVESRHFDEAIARVKAAIERSPKASEPQTILGEVYLAQAQTNLAETAFSKAIELSPSDPHPYLALAGIYVRAHKEDQALERLNSLVAKTNNISALMQISSIQGQKKHYEAARDALEKLLTVDPKFSPALNDLAYMYAENLGNLSRAAELAQQAHDLYPQVPAFSDTLGWILFKQGQFPRALALLQESQEKRPNAPEVTMHLGMVYYMMDNEDLARLYLQRAVDSPSDYPEKETARQSLAFLAMDPEKATPAMIEELQKRVRDNPHDPVPMTRLAAIEERQGEAAKAADIYHSLIQQNPKNAQALLKLAHLYAGPLKDPRQAMNMAKSAHDLAPNDPHADALLGKLAYQSGDYPWALSLLQEAANQLPNQPALLYDLAWADYVTGREAEADTKMSEAAAAGSAFPDQQEAKQFLALRAAWKDASKAPAVAAEAQTILQKQPNYLPALMISALLRQQQGSPKEAASIYEQILNSYPQFAPAMRQLAVLYTETGENDAKAYDLAEKARSSRPDDPGLRRALGILAFRRGDATMSKKLLQESQPQFTNDGALLYYLGMDYYKLKQRNESKDTLQRALHLNLPDKMAGDARQVLAELK
ncbi:MAG: tetratricopeptide repeat protein [Limisphaerales bacterium]